MERKVKFQTHSREVWSGVCLEHFFFSIMNHNGPKKRPSGNNFLKWPLPQVSLQQQQLVWPCCLKLQPCRTPDTMNQLHIRKNKWWNYMRDCPLKLNLGRSLQISHKVGKKTEMEEELVQRLSRQTVQKIAKRIHELLMKKDRDGELFTMGLIKQRLTFFEGNLPTVTTPL